MLWNFNENLNFPLSAARSHSGVTLVPNLFGKPTILVVGGGSLNDALDEVVSATPYVESAQVNLFLNSNCISS